MLTVHEVAEFAKVSVRTLQYYDRIGLLRPAARSKAGYRLYDDDNLVRLQQILLFRELEFSLKDIGDIVNSPEYDRSRALQQQIQLLRLRRRRIDELIDLATSLKDGVETLTFKPFDTSEIDEYTAKAKEEWGSTPQWQEYERKSAGRTKAEQSAMGEKLLTLFEPFAAMAAEGADPASAEALAQAKRIQDFITEHWYTCTDEVFLQLGRAYGSGGDFTRNIDAHAGEGAGEYAMRAVEAYVASRS